LPSEIDSVRIDLVYAQAQEASHAGRSAEAARLYEQIANIHSLGEGRAFFFLLASYEYLEIGEHEKALEECRWAVAIKPHSHHVWRQLGNILKDVGQYKEAEEALSKSIELKPTKVSYIYLGCVQIETNRLSDAEDSFRKAIELAPEFDEAHYNLAAVLRDQGRLDEAVNAFNEAVRLSPDYAEAHGALGEVYSLQGESAKATQHLERCLELTPDDLRAKELLRSLQEDKGDEAKGDAAQ
jgi:tetratricopeptide (TPR) repeat protein